MSIAMIERFKRSGLPPTARLVAYMLAEHHNDAAGLCNPSVKLLQHETGLGRTAISAAIQIMIREKHLTIEKTKNNGNVYVLHPVEKESFSCSSDEQPVVRQVNNACSPSEQREGSVVRQTNNGCSPNEHPVVRQTNVGCSLGEHPNTIEPERTVIVTVKNQEVVDLFGKEENGTEKPKTVKKPFAPCPYQIRINRLYSRRDSTPWAEKELKAWRSIHVEDEDIAVIEKAHQAGWEYHRRDILTLLNNWQGEAEKARFFLKSAELSGRNGNGNGNGQVPKRNIG